jgi:hypothetical protein
MTNEDAKKAIIKLFHCYNWTGDETERKLKFQAYWEILGDLPPHRVVEVCRLACQGRVGQPGFMPTAGELYQAAFKSASSPGEPARGYPKLSSSPDRVIPADERARITQGFKDLLVELRAGGKQPKVPGWTSLGDALQPALRDWTTASGQLSSQSLDWPRKIGLQTETSGVEPPK